MNILIFEYITGGGMLGEALSSSLVCEGELMLNAVADDFAELPNFNVRVMRDNRLSRNQYTEDDCVVSAEYDFAQAIEAMSGQINALLIIAPESENILSNLCEKYSNREFVLLNSTTDSINLTSNKFDTYAFLKDHNITQMPTYEMSNVNEIKADKIVVKPKYGVGCVDLLLMDTPLCETELFNQIDAENYIAQPFFDGQSASLSLLCWQGECRLLTANIQNIQESDNSLVLEQCIVNALDRDQFTEFGHKLVKALPGLRGYIGVDILITDSDVLLLEVNPRLTTSYVGLKAALGVNPAELILHAFTHQELPDFSAVTNTSITVEVGAERAA